jgi:3-oxoacyl-[acyl-carrier protein] reductase
LDLGLTDKVAIVTGSSRGLGLAAARALVAEGCRVCLCARGAERLAEAAVEVEAAAKRPNMVMTVQADVSTPAGVDLVIARTLEGFGGLDILVNNVGRAAGTDILDTSDAEWQAAFDETLFPAIRASRAAAPHMKGRGGGAIIMIASIWGRESGGRMTYNAVKAAEISLAKAMAQQLAPLNIRVNSIAPGSILFAGGSWHKRQQADPAGIAEFIKRDLPFGRMGRADEVGSVVAFVASPRASWVSGACITVDGCQSRSNI